MTSISFYFPLKLKFRFIFQEVTIFYTTRFFLILFLQKILHSFINKYHNLKIILLILILLFIILIHLNKYVIFQVQVNAANFLLFFHFILNAQTLINFFSLIH